MNVEFNQNVEKLTTYILESEEDHFLETVGIESIEQYTNTENFNHIYQNAHKIRQLLNEGKSVRGVNVELVAFALSRRIVDEYDSHLEETTHILQNSLYTMLLDNPDECERLWSIGIIEEDYFDDILFG
jgi:hypothetical protein